MHLTKHHALGNDFLVTFVDEVPADAAALALDLCDRRTGIGADGLIFATDSGSTVTMRLFNSDGSPAEISGNGARCLLHAVALRRQVSELDVELDTPAGRRPGSVSVSADPRLAEAAVDMGPVSAGDAPDADDFLTTIPELAGVRRWAAAAVGNPHVVIDVANPSEIDLAQVGPAIETHFPHGVNAHMVDVSGPDQLTLHVWERGAGITQACGSGATVAAQRFHDWGAVGETVTVNMPGGSAVVDVATDARPTAVLRGSAAFVAAIEVPRG